MIGWEAGWIHCSIAWEFEEDPDFPLSEVLDGLHEEAHWKAIQDGGELVPGAAWRVWHGGGHVTYAWPCVRMRREGDGR